jgi:hypothetical protein
MGGQLSLPSQSSSLSSPDIMRDALESATSHHINFQHPPTERQVDRHPFQLINDIFDSIFVTSVLTFQTSQMAIGTAEKCQIRACRHGHDGRNGPSAGSGLYNMGFNCSLVPFESYPWHIRYMQVPVPDLIGPLENWISPVLPL